MPKIVVILPGTSDTTHELTEETVTVGRLTDNSVCIDDASVSSHHAKLTLRNGDYVLTDLHSTNGTRVNGQPVTEQTVRDGDVLQFGQVEVRYHSDNPSRQQPLPTSQKESAPVGHESHRPNDFSNASPFKSKGKKKNGSGMAVMALAGVAILAFVGAVATIFSIAAPQ